MIFLREALAALQQYPPERLKGDWEALAVKGDWEALAVRIARNKAVDAYRASQKGLGGTEHRNRLRIVSGDAEGKGLGGETRRARLELLPSDWDGPEVEYEQVEKAQVLHKLARQVLDSREREIVFAILKGRSRKEVGEELELTSQRVGQVFLDAMGRLASDPSNPFTSE